MRSSMSSAFSNTPAWAAASTWCSLPTHNTVAGVSLFHNWVFSFLILVYASHVALVMQPLEFYSTCVVIHVSICSLSAAHLVQRTMNSNAFNP
ncbi:hypothetical protein B0J12DRAFT_335410 [Macrophomina phaseolina]|uniref:Secreted protein n=1 Tax=Macrophomina phaseolina TaxID=35725 RepID=A0ABQ8GLF4_9PEZI|nr:hypothetical protein B0J12DRAFT_335410 [Macrophomina phaseolina]